MTALEIRARAPDDAPFVDAAPQVAPEERANPVVRATLFLFVLSIFFEIPHRAIPVEVDTATGLLFLASTLLCPGLCYRRLPAAVPCFAGYVWLLILSVLVNSLEHGSQSIFLAAKDIIAITLLCQVLWAAFNLLSEWRVMSDLLLAIALGGTLRGGLQILGVGASSYTVWTGGDRVTMFGQNANLSAMILSAALATVVGLEIVRRRGLPRFGLFTWPMAAVIGLATIQTGSRGGLLSAGVGLAAYWFRGHSMWVRLRNGLLGIFAVVALGVTAMNTEMMRNRLEQSANEGKMAGRELIYPAAIQMFLERPVLGWGTADNMFEVAQRIGDRMHATRDVHNLVLELLTTAGVLGALPFLVGLGMCIRAGWRARHGPLGALPAGVLAAVLMGCVSGTWIQSKILWVALALALAAGTHWVPQPRPATWSPV